MMKKLSLFVLLCFVLCVFSQVPARVHAATWWNSSYNYKMKLTIDQTKVDADLTDFPVLVNLTSARINWAHVQDDLDDIRFVDSTETTVLKAELEKYIVNDKAWIWVKIPTVDDVIDTDFYMYYGNTGVASAWDAENVWEASAVMVQHMRDLPDNAHIMDSTGYDNDGTKKAADEPIETASGKIDSALSFDGLDDYISINDADSLDFGTGDFTLIIWEKTTEAAETFFLAKTRGDSPYTGFDFSPYYSKARLRLFDSIGNQAIGVSTASINTGLWVHVAVSADRSGNAVFYINGSGSGSFDVSAVGSIDYAIDLKIGLNFGVYFNGIIDEVRIYNVAQSAAWIKADYNSGADTLLTYGAELTSLTVYYNIGISKLYINGTQTTNGTVVTTFVNKNVNATATVKSNFIFFKHKLATAPPNFTTPYIWNMTVSNTLWTYAVVSETAGASSGALIFTGILALIILIPVIWRRRR